MLKLLRKEKINKVSTLFLHQGDICELDVDVLLTTSNPKLILSHGLNKRLLSLQQKKMANYQWQPHWLDMQVLGERWVKKHGEISPGKPAFSAAHGLRCNYVIYAVLPNGGQELKKETTDLLVRCLDLAELLLLENEKTPFKPAKYAQSAALSTEFFSRARMSMEDVASLMVAGCYEYLRARDTGLTSIHLVVPESPDTKLFETQFQNTLV